MTFGFAILICSFFEWASWVPGAQLIPRAIPHMWCHLALQVHHQFGSIKLHRLAPSEKGYWCIPKPENLARSLGILELHVEVLTFSLPINSIPYCKRQFDCLKSCLRWTLLLPDGSTENWIWLKPPLGIFNLFLQSLGDLRNDQRDESNDAASLESWNLRGHQAKTWRCDIVRYLKYHKHAIFEWHQY